MPIWTAQIIGRVAFDQGHLYQAMAKLVDITSACKAKTYTTTESKPRPNTFNEAMKDIWCTNPGNRRNEILNSTPVNCYCCSRNSKRLFMVRATRIMKHSGSNQALSLLENHSQQPSFIRQTFGTSPATQWLREKMKPRTQPRLTRPWFAVWSAWSLAMS